MIKSIKVLSAKSIAFMIKIALTNFRGNESYARYIGVKIGRGCRIFIKDFGSEPFLISIGNRVTIAHGVKIITHNGSAWLIEDQKGRRYQYQPVRIGDEVFIGMNSIILPGVNVGNRVIIGAGSIVTKSIPNGKIVAGNPAKIIGNYEDYEFKAITSFVSQDDIVYNLPYSERVNLIVDKNFKKELL